MKHKSLIAAGLLAVGLISSASANTYVYLTGSTAFRATTYTAVLIPGAIFDANGVNGSLANPAVVSVGNAGANNSSGANDIVYEGYINGVVYDLVCEWTGSEAGIASVSGLTTFPNDTPFYPPSGPSFTSPLPGVPPKYLIGPNNGGNWTVQSAAGTYVTDLSLADTSQAVSLTKAVSGTGTDLVPYGIVGIVTFEWCKGKNSAPATSSWGHITALTHGMTQNLLNGPGVPRLITGNYSDPDSDTVVVVGRNKGSGTHANCMLDNSYATTHVIDQFAIKSSYVAPGVLTFGTIGAFTDNDVIEVGNDGFDSGGSVAKCLECDGTGSAIIPIGYMGLSDAAAAVGGGAVALTLDGYPENNYNVENGLYSFWGHENLYGKHGQLSTDAGGILGSHLKTGIPVGLASLTWGTVALNQDAGIPTTLMHVDKSGDSGYPAPIGSNGL